MREQLLDRLIRIYGFENIIVIAFASLIENDKITTDFLVKIVEFHEKSPQIGEDEEE